MKELSGLNPLSSLVFGTDSFMRLTARTYLSSLRSFSLAWFFSRRNKAGSLAPNRDDMYHY